MFSLLRSKFRGCMIGGLLGDCIGEPFEVEIGGHGGRTLLGKFVYNDRDGNVKTKLKNFLSGLLSEPNTGACEILHFTDDTAMALSVGNSLVEKGMFDPKDMARKFVDEYTRNPYKGYGSNVVNVFRLLKQNDCKDAYGPAQLQFGGTGSCGNGASMRVAPVSLFAYKDEELVKEIAKNSALITHAHPNGYNGAILIALAVHQALEADPSKDFDPMEFVDNLLVKMEAVEKELNNVGPGESQKPYCESLKQMKQILEKQHFDITPEEVETIFGNHVVAQKSAPTAVFCFLRGFYPILEFESTNPFVRTLYFAIAVGGDTDTIACMAGNIAGAYHGESIIPENLQKHCEAVEELGNLGDKLLKISYKPSNEN